jgi:hypothetical protein
MPRYAAIGFHIIAAWSMFEGFKSLKVSKFETFGKFELLKLF